MKLTKWRALVLAMVVGLGLLWAFGSAPASLVGKPAPEWTNDTWINSEPLRVKDLEGKVILIEFWTYG